MTNITELAQRLATCAKEESYPALSPAECGALVEALEKAQVLCSCWGLYLTYDQLMAEAA
ncbi:TPA: hypothetical protein R4Z25_005150 [Klebsiella oxytoca]|nr:hypothetical protein [Klebsiella oxytoca]